MNYAEIRKLPSKVDFDICTFCNHSCTFCSNEDKRTLKKITTYTEFKVAMDNILKYTKIKELGLSAKGEPLINTDLVKIIQLAKQEYGIDYIYISTNGVLANTDKMETLFTAGLDSIKFSINAVSKEDYFAVHRKNDFDLVIQNLASTIRLKKDRYDKVKIYISFVNKIDKNEMLNFLASVLFDDIKYIDDVWKYDELYSPKVDDFVDYSNIKHSTLSPCKHPFNTIFVDSDCTLTLCCVDFFGQTKEGSLLREDFLELWFSENLKRIREMHTKRDSDKDGLCYKCLVYNQNIQNKA